ncbi:MAG TPA: bifunctional precorrin-2 dehydrogenase/sirohydrochlorin ferrochelatase, partial [Actinobacteria bacterium]|nr:bifunctional precorrin-2 dehydrogenase/sirohydrochlorin ferrochelatase [Actinomycetes bacterium]HEX21059.1 bifunctional precorrin-2 dehydrogenase/sirohydrochlorin ferrochelatase [Actinomycetota bacterium]
IFREAETNNILINVVDKPELCSFFMPAVVNRGDLQIAVSTNGKSPALAKRIRRRLEEEYGPEYAPWLNLVSEYRRKIMQKEPDKRKRKQAYDRLFNSNILEKVRKLSRNNPEMVNNKIDVDKLISRFSEQ